MTKTWTPRIGRCTKQKYAKALINGYSGGVIPLGRTSTGLQDSQTRYATECKKTIVRNVSYLRRRSTTGQHLTINKCVIVQLWQRVCYYRLTSYWEVGQFGYEQERTIGIWPDVYILLTRRTLAKYLMKNKGICRNLVIECLVTKVLGRRRPSDRLEDDSRYLASLSSAKVVGTIW